MILSIIFILLLILTHNFFFKHSVFFHLKHTVFHLISGFPNFITLTKNNFYILINKKFIIILNFKLLLSFLTSSNNCFLILTNLPQLIHYKNVLKHQPKLPYIIYIPVQILLAIFFLIILSILFIILLLSFLNNLFHNFHLLQNQL